jgi:hypothetical protein
MTTCSVGRWCILREAGSRSMVATHGRLEEEAEVVEAVCSGPGDEAVACSRARDEAAVCSRAGIEDDRWWQRRDGF